MSANDDMTTILEDLAAAKIDPAEAARRIDAISATNTAENTAETSTAETSTAEPSTAETSTAEASTAETTATDTEAAASNAAETTAAQQSADADPDADLAGDQNAATDAAPDAGTDSAPDPDAWAASTDRPQQPTHTREDLRAPSSASRPASDSGTAAGSGSSWPRPRLPRRPQGTNGVEKLSVRAVGRRVRIVGEPSVATVSADGPHVLRRNGSVLEVSSDGEFGASIDGFQLLRATRSLDDFRSLGLGKELLLRVNPNLLVDVEVTAGSLNTEGVPRLGSVRVTAGGAKLLDVSEIADALIQAGQATVKGAITSGRSRIRVESGSLNLQLSDASNVTIGTDSQLGKISWGGAHAGFAGDEVVMGHGAARLDVEVVMGHASVKAGSGATSTSGAA